MKGPTYSYSDGAYLIRTAMSRTMARLAAETAEGLAPGSGELLVLDIGGRDRPYAGLFTRALGRSGRPVRYLVVDPGPGGDITATAEDLPVADGKFDLILSTQVLEHVNDPARTVAEMSRALAPGGTCLLTTHGTWFYHPDPEDRWRWTSAGLKELFTTCGFRDVAVHRIGGTKLSLSVLVLTAIDRAGEGRLGGGMLRKLLIGPANFLTSRILGYRDFEPAGVPGELVINYLVTARQPRR